MSLAPYEVGSLTEETLNYEAKIQHGYTTQ